MCEVEPQQTGRGLVRIAQEIMVIGPDDGDEQIAHGVAQPCGPEQQKRLEGGKLGRMQIQDQHGDENGKYAVGKRAQSLGSCFAKHGHDTRRARAAAGSYG